MPKRRKPNETVGLTLRIKEDLRRKLARAAKHRGVSLNREIERRLELEFCAEALLETIQRSQTGVATGLTNTANQHTCAFSRCVR